jgi:hypothetical protein
LAPNPSTFTWNQHPPQTDKWTYIIHMSKMIITSYSATTTAQYSYHCTTASFVNVDLTALSPNESIQHFTSITKGCAYIQNKCTAHLQNHQGAQLSPTHDSPPCTSPVLSFPVLEILWFHPAHQWC